jgi:hypothetical protein
MATAKGWSTSCARRAPRSVARSRQRHSAHCAVGQRHGRPLVRHGHRQTADEACLPEDAVAWAGGRWALGAGAAHRSGGESASHTTNLLSAAPDAARRSGARAPFVSAAGRRAAGAASALAALDVKGPLRSNQP